MFGMDTRRDGRFLDILCGVMHSIVIHADAFNGIAYDSEKKPAVEPMRSRVIPSCFE